MRVPSWDLFFAKLLKGWVMESGAVSAVTANLDIIAVGAVGMVLGVFLTILVMKPAVLVAVCRILGVVLVAAGTGLLVCGISWMTSGDEDPGKLGEYFANARECIGAGAGGLAGGVAAIVMSFFRANRNS